MLLLCAAYLSFEDLAGLLMRVSRRFDKSPTTMGRFGAPTWAKPNAVPNQQIIHPLGGTPGPLLADAVPGGAMNLLISSFRFHSKFALDTTN